MVHVPNGVKDTAGDWCWRKDSWQIIVMNISSITNKVNPADLLFQFQYGWKQQTCLKMVRNWFVGLLFIERERQTGEVKNDGTKVECSGGEVQIRQWEWNVKRWGDEGIHVEVIIPPAELLLILLPGRDVHISRENTTQHDLFTSAIITQSEKERGKHTAYRG